MDFEKIKPAVEEISLDDIQKAKIFNACKNKKRKFNFKPVVGIAAAAAVITLVIASPGFLFRASKANDSALDYFADSEVNFEASPDGLPNQIVQNTLNPVDFPLFETDEFLEIYALIPVEFSSLVNADEYQNWASTVTADGGMAMVQFVEYFSIPREAFEKANSLYRERTFADISDSVEYFNEDIIYSGNRNAVDNFYKK